MNSKGTENKMNGQTPEHVDFANCLIGTPARLMFNHKKMPVMPMRANIWRDNQTGSSDTQNGSMKNICGEA
jgi:hypothetical protein